MCRSHVEARVLTTSSDDMSAAGQTSGSRDIPAVRRVAVLEAAHMPQEYSTTPGGTMFSTTPGGTRIIYDRKFLLQCRTSPLTRTPPKLPDIPGVTTSLKRGSSTETNQLTESSDAEQHSLHAESAVTLLRENASPETSESFSAAGDDAQFDMDI
ncbi:eukaryotic translation initiation factor 4E-binding protein 1-like isoform X2 [Entelurus aequoreus]|uniref:eukaryotic translation initiation factor 4E-binding protein 1-like isoform X2 n=1 Tax=Entelurus aequoreus TaxID=161455 RepID=UPI002B1DC772|nr:eukaryotic translation initiation factor 4E-binding protein 1-like isoform X2 [Entelurus aequoreus]